MSRKIQIPDTGVQLADSYGIKGGLGLSLDETIVPVHIVAQPEQGGGNEAIGGGIVPGSRGAMGKERKLAGGVGNWGVVVIQTVPRGSFPFLVEWVELFNAATNADTFFGGIGWDPLFAGAAPVAGTPWGFTEPRQGVVFGAPLEYRTTNTVGAVAPGPVIFETSKQGGNEGRRHYLNWRIGTSPQGPAANQAGNDRAFFVNGTLNQAWSMCAKVWIPPVTR